MSKEEFEKIPESSENQQEEKNEEVSEKVYEPPIGKFPTTRKNQERVRKRIQRYTIDELLEAFKIEDNIDNFNFFPNVTTKTAQKPEMILFPNFKVDESVNPPHPKLAFKPKKHNKQKMKKIRGSTKMEEIAKANEMVNELFGSGLEGQDENLPFNTKEMLSNEEEEEEKDFFTDLNSRNNRDFEDIPTEEQVLEEIVGKNGFGKKKKEDEDSRKNIRAEEMEMLIQKEVQERLLKEKEEFERQLKQKEEMEERQRRIEYEKKIQEMREKEAELMMLKQREQMENEHKDRLRKIEEEKRRKEEEKLKEKIKLEMEREYREKLEREKEELRRKMVAEQKELEERKRIIEKKKREIELQRQREMKEIEERNRLIEKEKQKLEMEKQRQREQEDIQRKELEFLKIKEEEERRMKIKMDMEASRRKELGRLESERIAKKKKREEEMKKYLDSLNTEMDFNFDTGDGLSEQQILANIEAERKKMEEDKKKMMQILQQQKREQKREQLALEKIIVDDVENLLNESQSPKKTQKVEVSKNETELEINLRRKKKKAQKKAKKKRKFEEKMKKIKEEKEKEEKRRKMEELKFKGTDVKIHKVKPIVVKVKGKRNKPLSPSPTQAVVDMSFMGGDDGAPVKKNNPWGVKQQAKVKPVSFKKIVKEQKTAVQKRESSRRKKKRPTKVNTKAKNPWGGHNFVKKKENVPFKKNKKKTSPQKNRSNPWGV